MKFNIGHMSKEYKRKLMKKHQVNEKEEGDNIDLKHDPIQEILLQQILA